MHSNTSQAAVAYAVEWKHRLKNKVSLQPASVLMVCDGKLDPLDLKETGVCVLGMSHEVATEVKYRKIQFQKIDLATEIHSIKI